ncbi:MAG: cytochrome c-type biogenesis CcmF C-terminal domain-containing protein [Myxococcota bacterium]
MPALDLPFLGNIALCLVLVSAAYAFAMGVGAGRGRPNLLAAARAGTYATCAFITLAIALLAYAFQSHDFRIIYVARYSDRSMPWYYLFTSLWGGQDGSLLWWLFLLAGYTAAATRWLKGRYLELQPWILATLMGIMLFFGVVMLFAANPFQTYVATTPVDGEGLNPLLQNYWMVIHPPSLYMGFVGWSVPFAFVVAALVTGRLHDEWIKAARLWAMIAWTFLSVGLLLGCLWSYEELGWGGYWAWDPVENASFMPWLVGTAYLHSAIVQERYGMLKVWNVFLMCLTFFMTIFGTFLTRSGLIASVHSFARSDIGVYFVHFMFLIALTCVLLVAWRYTRLRADHRIESLVSREFMFLLNNWVLLGMMVFVLVTTTWPLISDWIRGQEITVGPGFYNQWMVPLGLMLLFLMGVGPLVSWRKATGKNLGRAMAWPAAFAAFVMVVHFVFGKSYGYPALSDSVEIYQTWTGAVLWAFQTVAPVTATTVSALVFATIVQEFVRGAGVRMRSKKESALTATMRLIGRAPRRYGGYIVHLGIVVMYFGFTGAVYDQEAEGALRPGETIEVADYTLRYDRPLVANDPNKRALYGQMTLMDGEQEGDQVHPAKFVYTTHPDMPTTEVAIRSRLSEDLYVIMSTVDQDTERATFRIVVRPFVAWIWVGGIILLLGCLISMGFISLPKGGAGGVRKPNRKRAAAAAAALLALGLGAPDVASAQADGSSSLHAGTVVIEDPEERQLFGQLLCQCGSCARLPLDTCGCGWAEDERAQLRMQLEAGARPLELVARFRAQYGAAAISIPADEGFDRALWAIPISLLVVAAFGVGFIGRRWKSAGSATPAGDDEGEAEDYDERLDEELRQMELD